ncbi:SGNH/GDSL hydrolase family protein [Streptomyces sp. BPTC-684]|uniref:SGNH/GDSL hydrolase family protein n=1 Tax=Streptomyces sp. BPTC-684 TaxID=3043734 RepID=UPI0024B21351|nr:SGNH/GDSL hydrolase family protein [Streptomyces sp. BPTC-684]WHM40037.1 SGNH/GDSL hydrolase family protein [Streptomyces sp. BPTC-684]
MEQQKKLTPHMRHYEEFATGDIRWLPYVMFFNRPDFRSPVVNTDAGGFRLSTDGSGSFSLKGRLPEGEVSVLLGASPAFGFGATSDAATLSSLLSRGPSSASWLNLAAPAFNSAQEVLIFLMHRDLLSDIQDIVVFSGLNNLVVAGLPMAGSGYGQFFFSGEFFRQLGASDVDQGQQPGWARGRVAQAARRIGRGGAAEEKPQLADPQERITIALRNTARDLDRLLELAAPTGARVRYVLQPTASWTGKRFTEQERLLIEENDTERARMWDLFKQILDPAVHSAYAEQVEAACKQRGVPFLDASRALNASPDRDRWLFLDQTHLTDEGNRVVSGLIQDEFELDR